jgi:hypothetical protein
MRTLQELLDENEMITRKHKGVKDEKKLKQARRTIKANNEVITILRNGLTEEHLRKQLEDIENKIAFVDMRYPAWLESLPIRKKSKNPRDAYEKETGLAQMKKQLRYLKKILSS